MKKLYVFLGPPGSGKGTQAQLLRDSLDCVVVSTGDLLREEITRATVLGKKIQKGKKYCGAGDLHWDCS